MIEFTENKYGNLALSGIYLVRSLKHFRLSILDGMRYVHEKVIKRYPLAVIAVVILVSSVICAVEIGKARAERDKLNHELYLTNEKLESYEAAMNK